MIPTTVTNSSPSTATGASNSNSNSGSGNISTNNSSQQNSSSLMIGIAALILEGRAIGEDEYQPRSRSLGVDAPMFAGSCDHAASSGSGSAGRHSPKPSTSRAAVSGNGSASGHVINITTNPHDFGCAPAAGSAAFFINLASLAVESTHQRYAQKLCQLRQESPAASLTTAYDPKVAVEAQSRATPGEPEFVALAIADLRSERGDYEIVRRAVLKRGTEATTVSATTGSSASSSPGSGSENFLHSLQSLATTCLRGGNGGSPSGDTAGGYRYSGALSPSPVIAPLPTVSPKYTSFRATPPPFPNPYTMDVPGSASSSGSGIQSPRSSSGSACVSASASVSACGPKAAGSNGAANGDHSSAGLDLQNKDKFLRHATCRIPIPAGCPSKSSARLATTTTPPTATLGSPSAASSSKYPQQGPHCDQFLRKMGLAKGEAAEAEDHFCDMSYVNITCSRWRAYCLKMEAIIGRGDPLCIEVYLGPMDHKILLEQWIITQKEKVPPPTMALPSLCSAIRSQLYFSQISAWCDLIKKADNTIYDTGRIIFSTPTGAAGDLATSAATTVDSAGSSPSSSSPLSSPATSRRPRLNIFYRIRQYDTSACFNSKPNVHNFPNVNISENYSISVCLKSLPRINGGIPRIGSATATSSEQQQPLQLQMPMQPATTTAVGGGGSLINMNINSSNGGSALGASPLPSTPPVRSVLASAAIPALTETPRTSRVCTTAAVVPDYSSSNHSNRSSSSSSNHSNMEKDCPVADQASSSTLAAMPTTSNGTSSASGAPKYAFCEVSDEDSCGAYVAESCNDDIDVMEQGTGSWTDHHANLAHRERQLMKYRKRMQKRDKKHRQPTSNASDNSCDMQCHDNGDESSSNHQPMDQGEEEADDRQEHKQCKTELAAPSTLRTSAAAAAVTAAAPTPAAATPSTRVNATAHIEMISTGTQTLMTCCQQCGNEKALICLKCSRGSSSSSGRRGIGGRRNTAQHSTGPDEMDSSSSLSGSDIIHIPRSQGEMLLQAIQRTPKAARKHRRQAMRAAAAAAAAAAATANGVAGTSQPQEQTARAQNNNHLGSEAAAIANGTAAANAGCQLCKRQKTQHNFTSAVVGDGYESSSRTAPAADFTGNNDENDNGGGDGGADGGGGDAGEADGGSGGGGDTDGNRQGSQVRRAMEEESGVRDVVTPPLVVHSQPLAPLEKQDCLILEQESFMSSTKLTTYIDRCTVSNCSFPSANRTHCGTPAPPGRSTTAREEAVMPLDYSKTAKSQFKTPTSCQQQPLNQHLPQHLHQHKQTPKPNLLKIASNSGAAGDSNPGHMFKSQNGAATPLPPHHNSLLLRKGLPKVNLTPIFCNSSLPAVGCATVAAHPATSPIPIYCASAAITTFSFDAAALVDTARHPSSALGIPTRADNNNIPVQKSFSAPTLPNSPSLSPRFAKQAAIYKRRSRHLSDRSDRSSLGSDEQFSDEDLENGVYTPVSSPVKSRSRIATSFGRRPLVGNLEESLLKKRLVPKIEVSDFRVQLGASGGFCPTQRTFPAVAYFYELYGETLSTPYVCEIRLPRKGYSVPRAGTIQATLLNPMGTVVRMFVIPYDLRDMPPLHQTFIRQRILAEASTNETVIVQQNSGGGKCLQNGHGAGDDNGQYMNGFAATVGSSHSPDQNANNNNNNSSSSSSNSNNNNNNNNNNKYRLSPSGGLHGESNLGHFISAEHMKRLRYSIHLRFQTSRSGRLMLHTDIRLLISRRTDCDTAAAHAKGVLEAPNDLVTDTVMPSNPKYSARQDSSSSKI